MGAKEEARGCHFKEAPPYEEDHLLLKYTQGNQGTDSKFYSICKKLKYKSINSKDKAYKFQ